MNLHRLLVIHILTIAVSAHAQNWLVLASHQQNKLSLRKQFSPIDMGTLISDRDTLIVADSGYVSVLHTSGAVFEFDQKGRYAFKDLKIDSSFSKGLSLFNFEDFKEMQQQIKGMRYKDIRHVEMYVSRHKHIAVFREKVLIDWNTAGIQDQHYFARLVQNDQILAEQSLIKNKPCEVDLSNISEDDLDHNKSLFIQISASDAIFFDQRYVQVLNQNEEDKQLYQQLKKAESLYTHVATSAVENYMLGLIYYKNHLHFKAVQAFKRAHLIHPKIKRYREDYREAAYLPLY